MSTAKDIAQALTDRLATITTANGYTTNIGSRVMRGRRRLDEKHLPCAVIIDAEDEVPDQMQTGNAKIRVKYVIEGHSECDADNPNDTAHDMIADIKRALWGSRITFGANKTVLRLYYNGRGIAPREDGMAVVSASVQISADYAEDLSSP